MIMCPKCGKVERYGIKEFAHRVKIFNNNDECVETTEYTGFRYDQPRCVECGSIVRFYIEPQENDEQGEAHGYCVYHEIECDFKGDCVNCPHHTEADTEWFKEVAEWFNQDEEKADSEDEE